MIQKLLTLIIAFLFIGGCILFKHEKTTWIWDASSLKNSEPLLSFFEKQKVADVYVQVDSSVSDSIYQSFIQKAHEQDIRVHALDGSPDYTERDLDAFLNRIRPLDWDGIHLDIEPYLSNEWKSDQKKAVSRYEGLIKQAADSGWTLGADIPFWYDEVSASTGETLAEFVIQHADYTVIMAYRDSAEKIMDVSAKERAIGRTLEKKVLIAVETISGPEAEGISFFGKSAAYFERELKTLENECGCQVAVHHAESWKTLLNQ